jgi:hypothetical protein
MCPSMKIPVLEVFSEGRVADREFGLPEGV